jgi:multiple sugar transport system substrate-binding protein
MSTRRQFLRSVAGVAVGAAIAPALGACSNSEPSEGSTGNGSGEPSNPAGPASTGANPTAVGSTGGATATAGDATLAPSAVSGKIQFVWWGGADRAKTTQDVIKDFQAAYSGVKVTPQFTDWGNYWQKLSTEAAGHSLPDVIQMSTAYVEKYATSGQLLDIGGEVSKLALGDTDKAMLTAGTVDGKLYGVGAGGTMVGVIYDQTILEKAGMTVPADGFTWGSFSDFVIALQPKLPKKVWACIGNNYNAFEVYGRQLVDELWTADGKIAFTKDIVLDWFAYWDKINKAGAVAPPGTGGTGADSGSPEDSLIVKGYVAFTDGPVNEFPIYAGATKDALAMTRIPTGGTQAGDAISATMLYSFAANTKAVDAALAFVAYLLHDPDPIKKVGLDKGIPGNPEARTVVTQGMDAADKAMVDFISTYGPKSRATTVVTPGYRGQISDAFDRATDSVGHGTDYKSAVDTFWSAAQKAEQSS